MNTMKKALLLSLAGMALLLAGCSKQSVTDFTPYPSNQGVVQPALHPIEKNITTASGALVVLGTVYFGVNQIVPVSTTAGQKSASIQAHSHEEEHEEAEAAEETTPSGSDNQETADSTPLVPLMVNVNRFVNLLEETVFGSLSLRSGAETAWKMVLTPLASGTQTGAILISGTVKLGALESPLQVVMPETVTIEFPIQEAVTAGKTQEQGFALDSTKWFAGLPLETLVGSGPILIDKEHHDLLHPFVQNVKASAQTASHDHE